MSTLQSIKIELQEHLKTAVSRAYTGLSCDMPSIGTPPNPAMGDFAIPCFTFSKILSQKPEDIAKKLVKGFRYDALTEFKAISADGPYINITMKDHILFRAACNVDLSQGSESEKRIMVEFLSPNTNKPLHLGHIRNGAIGMTVSKLLEHRGDTVVKANLINDRGIHICKSMVAWEKFGEMKNPELTGMKGDHFVGKYYVLFNTLYNDEVADLVRKGMPKEKAKQEAPILLEAQQMLRRWEHGDQLVIAAWKKMNEWVYEGFEETYDLLGLSFDTILYESETYKLGKDIIDRGLSDGIFEKEENGTIVFKLPEETFGKNKDGSQKSVTVLRADGTSVYMTQDIGTARKKVMDHDLTTSIYVVGDEQNHHFQCLFKILSALGYEWADQCFHLSYGMVHLLDGKMKSREGKTVEADNLVPEIALLAADEIRNKHGATLSEEEIMSRAQKIALAAIKFFLLRVDPKKRITFDSKQSLAFEGATGPYCQYAYARASGIIEKAKKEHLDVVSLDESFLGNNVEERILAQKLLEFPEKVASAANDYNPSILTDAVYDVAKAFSQFYNKHQVIGVSQSVGKARLVLVESVQRTLELGFYLLGIETLKEM